MIKTLGTALFLGLSLPGVALAETRLGPPVIAESHAFETHTIAVLDSTMAWIETGSGAPVLFLHGNPTSSFLWRNVLPELAGSHRAIAVDLIGMGASGKPDIGYHFADHADYLEAFIDEMNLETVTLVGHDWGAALAWDFAARHPDRVSGVAFMEGVLPPAFPLPNYAVMGETGEVLRALRTPETGEAMVLGQNMFVEQMLPGFVNRPLSEAEMDAYRAPFVTPNDRLPTLQWPRELPIAGAPADTVTVMERIATTMQSPTFPVQLLYVEPGVIAPAQSVDWYRQTIPGLETVYLGQGLHFIQEDHPQAIGRAIADWLRRQN